MFKSKWQKKYEKAIETVKFWEQFYKEQSEMCSDLRLSEIHTAQYIVLGDTLRDLKKIAES